MRPDGFHDLATVYQALSLYDVVEVGQRTDGRGPILSVAGRESATVPTGDGNLAWQAAELAAKTFDRTADVTITIDKGIPVAGGMAGGSADAAGVLRAVTQLWQVDVAEAELAELATQLGSDVPFALLGGTAVGAGRGEIVTSAMGSGTFHWVLALSDGQLSTPAVYRALDQMRPDPTAVPAPQLAPEVLLAVRTGDAVALGRALDNDLQPAAVALMPPLQMLLELGPEHGALGSLVSGSGPTCAFLVADEESALELAVALSASGLCRAVRRAVGPVPGATVIE